MTHAILMFDNVQEQQWQVGAIALEVFIFGASPRVFKVKA
jgi:hypothetical protein